MPARGEPKLFHEDRGTEPLRMSEVGGHQYAREGWVEMERAPNLPGFEGS